MEKDFSCFFGTKPLVGDDPGPRPKAAEKRTTGTSKADPCVMVAVLETWDIPTKARSK